VNHICLETMNVNRTDVDAWVDAYIASQPPEKPPDLDGLHLWAVERSMNLDQRVEAEEIWISILRILSRDPYEVVLAVLAASPLEDLIHC
jgi:hypothetical protein